MLPSIPLLDICLFDLVQIKLLVDLLSPLTCHVLQKTSPRMNPAVRLMLLRQGTRSIEDYVVDFLELAHLTHTDKICLMIFFHGGLSEPLHSIMPLHDPNWTLEKYMDTALQLSGSPFMVGATEELAESAPEPAPSQELAESAPEPAPSQELAESAPEPAPSQELAEFAPEPAPSQELAESAPPTCQSLLRRPARVASRLRRPARVASRPCCLVRPALVGSCLTGPTWTWPSVPSPGSTALLDIALCKASGSRS